MLNKFITWMYRRLNPPVLKSDIEPRSKRHNYKDFSSFKPELDKSVIAQNIIDRALVRKITQDPVYKYAPAPSFSLDGKDPLLELTKVTIDSASLPGVKNNFGPYNTQYSVQEMNWYSSQGFIGWQFCAILAQHWLVDKACSMPPEDAIRKGYDIICSDDKEIGNEVYDYLKQLNREYKINLHLEEFVKFGNVFGFRVALFNVDYGSPEQNRIAYEKPFNIDNVKPNSYKGIVQVDPYWISPQFDPESVANPADPHFYEPTWWTINGMKYHRTHLIIMRRSKVADVLKPTYFYGGIPLTQQIYERVYGGETIANEAPLLVLTKRLNVLKTTLEDAITDQAAFEERMQIMVMLRDNYGIRVIDKDNEDTLQFDLSLTDLDAVIMTQYQIVAAIAGVPAVKLMGTTPKGFNATGEFEEAVYHEKLSTIQTHYFEPFLERHLLLVIRSAILPKFKIDFTPTIVWNPLDEATAKEKAEIRAMNNASGARYVELGVISPEEERSRLINDEDSGYAGLIAEELPDDLESDPEKESSVLGVEGEEQFEDVEQESGEFAESEFLDDPFQTHKDIPTDPDTRHSRLIE